jgi:hypothetical protein
LALPLVYAGIPYMPILEPKEYASPSGGYRLFVDPSDRSGEGPATYRLSYNGKEVWSGKRPFTLWEAGVTDDGRVGGYAYSLTRLRLRPTRRVRVV